MGAEDKPDDGGGASFETGLARLEALVEQLEGDPHSLEEGVRQYQEGVDLLGQLHQSLSAAEQRVVDLTEALRQGLEELEADDRNGNQE